MKCEQQRRWSRSSAALTWASLVIASCTPAGEVEYLTILAGSDQLEVVNLALSDAVGQSYQQTVPTIESWNGLLASQECFGTYGPRLPSGAGILVCSSGDHTRYLMMVSDSGRRRGEGFSAPLEAVLDELLQTLRSATATPDVKRHKTSSAAKAALSPSPEAKT